MRYTYSEYEKAMARKDFKKAAEIAAKLIEAQDFPAGAYITKDREDPREFALDRFGRP